MKLLDAIFDDKRVAIALLMAWLVGTMVSVQSLDMMHSNFMTIGPSNHTKFLTVSINTWHKWTMLASATFMNTCVTGFMGDAIEPWLQNTIQDHKTKYLPYSKFTCYIISQLWSVYCGLMSIFAIGLMTSQFDLLMVRMVADLMTSTFTTYKFMRLKVVDKAKYDHWNEDIVLDMVPLNDVKVEDS